MLPALKLRLLLFNKRFGLLRGSDYSNDCTGVRVLRFNLRYHKHRHIEIVQRLVSRTGYPPLLLGRFAVECFTERIVCVWSNENSLEMSEHDMISILNGFDGIIKQLEAQKTAIERALQALREVGGEVAGVSMPTAPNANDKRSAAQKARWAAKRAAEASPSAAPSKAKGGMTPEGRQKLAEAMKQRWAVKRTGAQVKRGPGRPRKLAAAA